MRKIWDAAPHNAFTDLILYRDQFYCTFREGEGHVPRAAGAEGRIRVIASEDARHWRPVALLAEDGIDLRDPKLSLTPAGRLMLLMGGSYYRDGQLLRQLSRVAFSSPDATAWGETMPVTLDDKIATDHDWLWRVTWRHGVAYGVVYQSADSDSQVQLVRSRDGIHYESVTRLPLDGRPNEGTIRFRDDGEMLLAIRREAGNQSGVLGRSRPPYTSWTWHEMTHRLGGPDLLVLPNGELLLATRKYAPDGATTMIGRLSEDGTVTELVKLPCGGDTSYPGMVLHDERLYVSYYASHEGKTAIYLAEIPLAMLVR